MLLKLTVGAGRLVPAQTIVVRLVVTVEPRTSASTQDIHHNRSTLRVAADNQLRIRAALSVIGELFLAIHSSLASGPAPVALAGRRAVGRVDDILVAAIIAQSVADELRQRSLVAGVARVGATSEEDVVFLALVGFERDYFGADAGADAGFTCRIPCERGCGLEGDEGERGSSPHRRMQNCRIRIISNLRRGRFEVEKVK